MNRPTFTIGSAAAMAIDLTEIRIRGEDRRAIIGIVKARDALIDQQVSNLVEPDKRAQRFAEQITSLATDAKIELSRPDPNKQLAESQLQLAAAMAISALRALEGQD